MILVDANVWIYFLDRGFPEHPAVRKHLPRLLVRDDALIPAIVQVEVIHYIARQMGERASATIDDFLSHPGEVEPLTGGAVAEAARLLLAHRADGVGGRDASILAIAKRTKAKLATADRPLAKVARAIGIDVVEVAR